MYTFYLHNNTLTDDTVHQEPGFLIIYWLTIDSVVSP